ERATEPDVIFGSKAVGEPPLMLAISAREAIRDAIAAFGSGGVVLVDSPLTPERTFWAVSHVRKMRASGAQTEVREQFHSTHTSNGTLDQAPGVPAPAWQSSGETDDY